MSLVAYGDSDCESDPDDVVSADVTKPSTDSGRVDVSVVVSKPFLTLPQSKSQTTRTSNDRGAAETENPEAPSKNHILGRNNGQEKIEDCPLFPTLPKPKAGGKVKIIIPSLNEVPTCDFIRQILYKIICNYLYIFSFMMKMTITNRNEK